MSNYSVLKQDINNNIYENQTQQITGTVLNAILNEMTASLGAGYQFAGVATLGMNPGDPDQRVFYLAGEGVYTNFGGLQVPAGKLGVLKWDNRWTLQTIDGLGGGGANLTGYVSLASTDDLPDEGVATLGYLCGENLYLYVGEGGDTKEGKYQNCGSFRGPQGDSVQDVEQTQTSLENGGVNKIKFTLSNGVSCEFQVRNGTTSSGLFPTLAALQAAYPSPVVGQYAFVGAGFPADIYVCTTAGTWTDSGEDYDGDNVDLTDYATKAEVTELEHDLIASTVYSNEEIRLVESSPYLVDTITGAYVKSNGTITSNQYTTNYKIWLFLLPAGKYVFTRTTNYSSSQATVAGTLASEEDFAVGSSIDSVIINASTDAVVTEVFSGSTYVFIVGRTDASKLQQYVTCDEIKTEYIRDVLAEVKETVDSIDLSELSADVADLEDEVYEEIAIGLDESSEYFQSTLTGAYVKSNGTITSNEYTGGYKIWLFLLPAGKYSAKKTANYDTDNGTVVGTLASDEDFVVGATIESAIIGASSESEVAFQFNAPTYLFIVGKTTGAKLKYYATANELQTVGAISHLQDEVANMFDVNLDIVIPDTVYAIVGTELNLYNDAVSLSIDRGLHSPLNYRIRWNCNKGTITDRCFRFTPIAGDVGNVSCACELYDMRGVLLASKTFTIKVLAKNALSSAKSIVYFGDSLGANVATNLYDNFHDSARFSGTIPKMLGTKGTTKNYEAVGGYKWSNYATAGTTAGYRISVSGVGSMSIGAVYSDGSHNFTVAEVNITEGVGNCLLEGSSTLTMPTGTLTKVSGAGDASVPYTGAYKESANPLWNGDAGELDIDYYKQTLVELGQLSSTSEKIDAVSFQFGINDNTLAEDLSTLRGYISDLYDLFINDNADCKFIVGLTTSCGNTLDGSGANYGASENWKAYQENTYKIRKFYLSLLTDFPNMRIATPNLSLDRFYGYPFGTRQISNRCTETEQYHTNFVHPSASGYGQMSDAYLACYVGVLTES